MTREQFEEIKKTIIEISNLPNVNLVKNMDILSDEYERVKNLIINQTYLLDEIEDLYNKTLMEYQKRAK